MASANAWGHQLWVHGYDVVYVGMVPMPRAAVAMDVALTIAIFVGIIVVVVVFSCRSMTQFTDATVALGCGLIRITLKYVFYLLFL